LPARSLAKYLSVRLEEIVIVPPVPGKDGELVVGSVPSRV
jgi:hypothetical protein